MELVSGCIDLTHREFWVVLSCKLSFEGEAVCELASEEEAQKRMSALEWRVTRREQC